MEDLLAGAKLMKDAEDMATVIIKDTAGEIMKELEAEIMKDEIMRELETAGEIMKDAEAAPKAKRPKAAPKPKAKPKAAPKAEPKGDRHTEEAKENKKAYASLNYKLKNMAADGNGQPLLDYQALDTKGKQTWVSKFKVDPKMAWLEGISSTAVGTKTGNNSEVHLLTPEQLGGSQWLNSQQHVQRLVDSGMLVTQPHEIKALAGKGVVQIKWSKKWESVEDFFKDQTKIKARGEMSCEDYEKVQAAMSSHSKSTGSATKVPKKVVSPAEKTMKALKADKQKALTAATLSITKIKEQINPVVIDPLMKKLETRPWGAEVISGIREMVLSIEDLIGEVHTVWADQTLLLKTDEAKFNIDVVKDAISKLDHLYSELDTKFLADAKEVGWATTNSIITITIISIITITITINTIITITITTTSWRGSQSWTTR